MKPKRPSPSRRTTSPSSGTGCCFSWPRRRGRVFELALHIVEGVAQRDVCVFVLHAVHAQLAARQDQVDPHCKRPTLMLMLVLL
jgi:hypothetical protein